MWHNNLLSVSDTNETTIEAFGLPSGRTWTSYYTNLNGGGLGMFVLAVLLFILIYFVLISRDGNLSQAIGWIAVIIVVVYVLPNGLIATQAVVEGTRQALWAWVTGP